MQTKFFYTKIYFKVFSNFLLNFFFSEFVLRFFKFFWESYLKQFGKMSFGKLLLIKLDLQKWIRVNYDKIDSFLKW